MSLRQVKFVAGVVAGLWIPGIALAQEAPAAEATPGVSVPSGAEVAALQPESKGFVPAAYLKGAARASEASIEEWIANPSGILTSNPAGGLPMANTVRSIAGSDNRAVAMFVRLGAGTDANSGQRAAIGAGLARAAQGAQSVAPDYAAYIQQVVAESGSPELIAAFTAALSETATAALGTSSSAGTVGGGVGATGGGSGTVTGGGSAGGGSAGLGGTSTTGASSGSFDAGGGGSVSGSADGFDATGTNGGVTTILLNASPS